MSGFTCTIDGHPLRSVLQSKIEIRLDIFYKEPENVPTKERTGHMSMFQVTLIIQPNMVPKAEKLLVKYNP